MILLVIQQQQPEWLLFEVVVLRAILASTSPMRQMRQLHQYSAPWALSSQIVLVVKIRQCRDEKE